MTAISRLLKQKPSLFARAVEQTLDVNEGYLIVHTVMVHALKSGNDPEQDLGPALARALDRRAKRLMRLEATA